MRYDCALQEGTIKSRLSWKKGWLLCEGRGFGWLVDIIIGRDWALCPVLPCPALGEFGIDFFLVLLYRWGCLFGIILYRKALGFFYDNMTLGGAEPACLGGLGCGRLDVVGVLRCVRCGDFGYCYWYD